MLCVESYEIADRIVFAAVVWCFKDIGQLGRWEAGPTSHNVTECRDERLTSA